MECLVPNCQNTATERHRNLCAKHYADATVRNQYGRAKRTPGRISGSTSQKAASLGIRLNDVEQARVNLYILERRETILNDLNANKSKIASRIDAAKAALVAVFGADDSSLIVDGFEGYVMECLNKRMQNIQSSPESYVSRDEIMKFLGKSITPETSTTQPVTNHVLSQSDTQVGEEEDPNFFPGSADGADLFVEESSLTESEAEDTACATVEVAVADSDSNSTADLMSDIDQLPF